MEGAEIYWYTGTLTNELISMSWQSYINATIDVFFFFFKGDPCFLLVS